ncbi:hypothetical protein N7489_008276 [Penicillium chrysogenum]|uniref:uncharacterized protein n=1 Tax=Penicillium chrysogenum TaxID=5076 RepID=UPI0024DF1093|nr:uncharacterized protein N7489_008276 [Penicillium chrysogenum]KAJ5238185.1 hypothetical protein N7489_008276 [Penicillium chrysogenum]
MGISLSCGSPRLGVSRLPSNVDNAICGTVSVSIPDSFHWLSCFFSLAPSICNYESWIHLEPSSPDFE